MEELEQARAEIERLQAVVATGARDAYAEVKRLRAQVVDLELQLTTDAVQVIDVTTAIAGYARTAEHAYQENRAALLACESENKALRAQLEATNP